MITHEKWMEMAHHSSRARRQTEPLSLPSSPMFRVPVKCRQRWRKAVRDPVVLTSLQTVEGGLHWLANGLRVAPGQAGCGEGWGQRMYPAGWTWRDPELRVGFSIYREERHMLGQYSGNLKDCYRMALLVGPIQEDTIGAHFDHNTYKQTLNNIIQYQWQCRKLENWCPHMSLVGLSPTRGAFFGEAICQNLWKFKIYVFFNQQLYFWILDVCSTQGSIKIHVKGCTLQHCLEKQKKLKFKCPSIGQLLINNGMSTLWHSSQPLERLICVQTKRSLINIVKWKEQVVE